MKDNSTMDIFSLLDEKNISLTDSIISYNKRMQRTHIEGTVYCVEMDGTVYHHLLPKIEEKPN